MNEWIIKGKWNQLKGGIKKNWGELTDDDLDVVEGNFQMLSGKIQERYGITQEEADKAIRNFGEINKSK